MCAQIYCRARIIFLRSLYDHYINNLKMKITVHIQYFLKKNRELYVNLTILAGFFTIAQSKLIRATFRNMEKTRLDELFIYVDKNFLLK